jgi:hypothetical protein
MAKFRKKPVVIEAVQYEGKGNFHQDTPEWLWSGFEKGIIIPTNGTDPLIIKTLEGDHVISPGDFLIKGIQGELYPCKPDIFEATYEPVID